MRTSLAIGFIPVLLAWQALAANLGSLPLGQVTTGAISAPTQTNSYTLSANANDYIDLAMITTSGTWSPRVKIYDAGGTLLVDDYWTTCIGAGIELNPYKLSTSGTYTVLVGDCSGASTGTYAVYLQRTSNPVGAAPLILGQVQSGMIASTAQNNTYTFGGAANDVLNFTALTATGNLSPRIRLYNPSGALLVDDYWATCIGSGITLSSFKLPATGTYTVLVGGCGNTGTGNYNLSTQCFGVCSLGTSSGPFQFLPLAPCRILDTRNANGSFGGPSLSAGVARSIPIPSSVCNVPANSAAYVLNITVVPKTTFGYLTVWPTGQSQPIVSTLNGANGAGIIIANMAIVPAGTGGSVNVFATDNADLILDITGYFVPPGVGTLQFYPLTPCRILDTRNAAGAFGGPAVTGSTSRSVLIASSGCNVPAGAAAYSFNVTAVPHGPLGYLTAWPTGQPQPVVSTLNSDGRIVPNAAIVPAGTGGAASFFASNTTDLVVDINGYFAAPGPGGLNFYTVTPCRAVDTRTSNAPSMTGGTTRSFPLGGTCALSASASAFSLNFTVVPQGPLGYLSTWPNGQSQPLVSTLNSPNGWIVANAALVPVGVGSAINVIVTNTTDVVIDTNGYFAP